MTPSIRPDDDQPPPPDEGAPTVILWAITGCVPVLVYVVALALLMRPHG